MPYKIYVLDTNVILTDSDVLTTYADKHVVVPDTVLAEVDKVKIGRADADTRYNGREFSRVLFELSEGRSLSEGVPLPGGGELSVLAFDTRLPMPEGFSSKNPDDRIVTAALRLSEEEKAKGEEANEVVLVTSDLNMLLKAQGLGLSVYRHADELNTTFTKRFIVKPFQKYRTPLAILMVALAVFAATVFVATRIANQATETKTAQTVLPSEYRNFVSEEAANAIDALILLQTQPKDATALATVGNAYYTLYGETVKKDPAAAVNYAKRGTEYYKRALEVNPDDVPSRCKMGILSLYAGDTDTAISQLTIALEAEPNNVEGNYYLAIVYMQGRHDFDNAEQLFKKVIELTKDNPDLEPYFKSSNSFLSQIEGERKKLANPPSDGVVL